MITEMDQYSTARPLFLGSEPAWVRDEQEQARIASYMAYEAIYWNVPESFKLIQRGDDVKPIYIPAAKTIVETVHQYLAPKMKIVVDPDFGSDSERALAGQVMTALTRREKLYSKFSSNKRFGIIRGDWFWHIYADPKRPAGSRISIYELDPASVFAIYNEDNLDEIIGYHIVEPFEEDGKSLIRRLTYRKQEGKGGPSRITVEDKIFEADNWGGPGMLASKEKVSKVIRQEEALPEEIEHLPLYHVQNFREPGTPWGSSELRGLERILAAVNQSISDEELSLAMEGLGCYATNAGAPIDPETDEELPWNLGPGKVVEVPENSEFKRVSGINSVAPMQDHLKYLHNQIDLATGTTPAAKGRTEVAVAESGVAMLIELGPLFSRIEEKDQLVTDTHTNMFYDLRGWFRAYDGINIGEAVWIPEYGDKLPPNNKRRFEEVMRLYRDKVVSAAWTRKELKKLGYDFGPDDAMLAEIIAEQEAISRAKRDDIESRTERDLEELEGEDEEDEEAK